MLSEIASNIYKIPLPLPGKRPGHINVYLIKRHNHVMLLDTGISSKDSWETLKAAFDKLGNSLKEITDIFITHWHGDHMGQLALLRQLNPSARLYVHQEELEMIKRMLSPETRDNREQNRAWLHSYGADELNEELIRNRAGIFPAIQQNDNLMTGGDKFSLGSGANDKWEVLWTPGHTPGHSMLYNLQEGLLFSGDHLVGGYYSFIRQFPGTLADPLRDFFESLRTFENLPVQQVLPGHGENLTGYSEHIIALFEHHQKMLERVQSVIEGEPRTALEVAIALRGHRSNPNLQFIILGEILAYLSYLVSEKRACLENSQGVFYYKSL